MKIINLSLIISSIDKDVKQLEFSTTLRKQVSTKPKPMHTLICIHMLAKKHTGGMFLTALFVSLKVKTIPNAYQLDNNHLNHICLFISCTIVYSY